MSQVETVKEMLEHYAERGLNPFQFADKLAENIYDNEQLQKIFERPGTDLSKTLFEIVDNSVKESFETQDNIDTTYTWKHLRNKFKLNKDSFRVGANKGKITKDNENMKPQWHIYKTSDNETVGEYRDRWEFIHYLLKYKLMYPAIWLLRKVIGNKLKLNIPATPYNEGLMLFDTAFEDTIRDWNLLYLKGLPNPQTAGKPKEWWDYRIKNGSMNNNLRTMKDLVLAICQTDTAYREFLNLLIHNIGRHGAIHYKKVEEAGNGAIRHVFYSSGFAEDVHYYHYYRMLRDINQTRLVETGKVEISDKPEGDDTNDNRAKPVDKK